MQIAHKCRMRAAILEALANDDPELKNQLRYVASEWLTLANLRERLADPQRRIAPAHSATAMRHIARASGR